MKLKDEEDDSDFDDWQGVSRQGESDGEKDKRNDNDYNDDDDDGPDGGVMMPVPDASF